MHFFKNTNASGVEKNVYVYFLKQNLVGQKYGHENFLIKIMKWGWKNECAGARETEDQFFLA